VLLLPLGNPIRIAEEIATLDHISQGRLDLGIGRGTFPEHHDAFLSPYPESRGRFEEYLEIILKAWSTEQFSFEGEHYQCYDLAVRPKPYQKPHPPIRVGITSAETFPIIGRMGYPVFVNPSRVFALSDLKEHVEAYQRAWKDAGHPGKGNVGIRLPVYLAETKEQAYEEPRESTMTSMQGIGQRVAASASRQGTTGNWQAESDHILSMNYDDWLRDKVIFGTPESVLDRLLELTEELQLSCIVFENNLGRRIPYDKQIKSLGLLVDRVVPHLP
jgi:alkanesulfonate monooxygenase SsuD/methylene tetrahydromethanopterin reductase-like flavin-dependent oxidoreductase (luciferase family)